MRKILYGGDYNPEQWPEPVEVPVHTGGVDLPTATRPHRGQTVNLDPYGVLVVHEDEPPQT